jgi:hypothetical protein
MYHYHIHGALSAPHNMYWVCMTSIRLAAYKYERDQRNTLVEFNKAADAVMDKYVDDFLKWSLMVDPRPTASASSSSTLDRHDG